MDSDNGTWRIAEAVRVLPYAHECPEESFYLIINVANKHWLKVTTQAHDFLLKCGGDRPLAEVVSETSRLFGVEEAALTALRAEFIRQGFLVQAGREQEVVCDAGCTAEGGILVYLNVTERCNLNCPMCYFNAVKGGKDPLTADEINQISDRLAANGVVEVVISGGEPLIRRDIFEILEHARPLFKKIYLLTNGTLLASMERCEKLAGLVDRVQVSLDGSRPEIHERIRGKGTFDRTIQGIKNLKRAGVRELTTSLTLNLINLEDAGHVLELAGELGVGFDFSRFTPIGRGYQNQGSMAITSRQMLDVFRMVQQRALEKGTVRMDPLYRQLGRPIRLKCGAGGPSFFSVGPDGSVYPCHVLHKPEFRMGNALAEGDLRSMIRNSPVVRLFAELEVDKRNTCKDCFVRYFCGGGCPANSYMAHGDILAQDPYCPFFHTFEMALLTGWRYDLQPKSIVTRVLERLQ